MWAQKVQKLRSLASDGEILQRSLSSRSRERGCLPHAQVICTKVRDADKRIVRLKEGEPRGRHVIIVDDLVQSGGTLFECQKLLKAQVRCWLHVYELLIKLTGK